MSLILDALKRADRERKLEQAPDLSAIYQEGQLNRRRFYSWFAGALLVAVIIFAFVFWPKEPVKDDLKDKSAETVMKASVPVQRLSGENRPDPLPVAKKTVNRATLAPPVPGSRDKGLNATQKNHFPGDQMPDPPENDRETISTDPVSPPLEDSGAAIFAGSLPDEKVGAKVFQPLPVKPFAPPGREKERLAVSAVPLKEVSTKEAPPSIDTLSEETKTLLEPLEINVHMYSSKPSERRVFINMHGYREGDTIGETGVRVMEITSNGVIIDYGEGKAMLHIKRK